MIDPIIYAWRALHAAPIPRELYTPHGRQALPELPGASGEAFASNPQSSAESVVSRVNLIPVREGVRP